MQILVQFLSHYLHLSLLLVALATSPFRAFLAAVYIQTMKMHQASAATMEAPNEKLSLNICGDDPSSFVGS